MLRSVMRLIFKTSSVTPDFFYVFSIILSFSTCSQSFKKLCTWEVLGANVLELSVKNLSCFETLTKHKRNESLMLDFREAVLFFLCSSSK